MPVRNTPLPIVSVIIIISLSSIATPVAAQSSSSPPDTVVLDLNTEKVATIEMQDQSYTVYNIKNALPYASGIEVYSNGQEITDDEELSPVLSRLAAQRTLTDVDTIVSGASITSRQTAQRQLTVVAWQLSAAQLSQSEIQGLQSVTETASRIDRTVSPVLTAVNTQLELFETMRNTGILGVTVWDAATEAYPTLEQYEQSLRTLKTELAELNQAAEGVTQNLTPALNSLQKAQQGERVDYQQLSQQLQQATDSLEQLQSKTDQVASSVSSAEQGATEGAQALRSTQVPSRFVDPLEDLSGTLEQATTQLEQLSSNVETRRQQLTIVSQTARENRESLINEWRSTRSSLKSGWQARQSDETRVYGTVGGVGIGVGGLMTVLLGRRFL